MTLSQRKRKLVDERFDLAIRHARLTTLRDGRSARFSKRAYDLMIEDIERRLAVVEARLQIIETNARSRSRMPA